MANRPARRFFFCRADFRIPHLGGTDLLTHHDQFPYQVPETPVFGELLFGAFDRRPLGNDLRDRFSTHAMSQ
jgi:hypothetical protein